MIYFIYRIYPLNFIISLFVLLSKTLLMIKIGVTHQKLKYRIKKFLLYM